MLAAHWIAFATLSGIVICAGVIDTRTGKVPNRLTYPAILAAWAFWLGAGLCIGGLDGAKAMLGASLTGTFSALLPYALLVLTLGLGGGDMKLMTAVGAWTASWQAVLSTTVYALIVAVLIALAIMIRRGLIRVTFSRILSAALMAGSRVKADLPEDGPKVPFAAAVAVGAMLAGAEQMLGLVTPWSAFNPSGF